MKTILGMTCLSLSAGLGFAADFPQVEITNGPIRAKLYLPDAQRGFYRGTRFDWSGVIASLEFQGHNYYGPWFDRMDPDVRDFIYQGQAIVAGPCSAVTGPAEEFQTNGSALGWDEAKPGETFIKIGVGVLRKDSEPYYFAKLYETVDPGKWTVATRPAAVQFTHELSDPATGYGYEYRKVVRLTEGKPELVLEHRLKNTGRRAIQTSVYNHNFLVLDRQPPGPDFTIAVPYTIQSPRPPNPELATLRGNQIVYLKTLTDRDVVATPVLGFGDSVQDHEIRIENRRVGAGLRITANRPLSHHALWSIRTVLSMEPFIAMNIPPGDEFTWTVTNEYYTLAPTSK
ncbi:MAG: hypothetical protein FJ387_00235 [Verrucomicrobia bacterium]|nr:hypothetical protein [Verrucomicrobiota bacterium]